MPRASPHCCSARIHRRAGDDQGTHRTERQTAELAERQDRERQNARCLRRVVRRRTAGQTDRRRSILTGYTRQRPNPDDVYFVHMLDGDKLTLTLNGSEGTDSTFTCISVRENDPVQRRTWSRMRRPKAARRNPSTTPRRRLATITWTFTHYAGAGTYELTASHDQTATNGAGDYEDNDPALEFTGHWTLATDAGYSKGTLKRLNAEGSVSFAFDGSEVAWPASKDRIKASPTSTSTASRSLRRRCLTSGSN